MSSFSILKSNAYSPACESQSEHVACASGPVCSESACFNANLHWQDWAGGQCPPEQVHQGFENGNVCCAQALARSCLCCHLRHRLRWVKLSSDHVSQLCAAVDFVALDQSVLHDSFLHEEEHQPACCCCCCCCFTITVISNEPVGANNRKLFKNMPHTHRRCIHCMSCRWEAGTLSIAGGDRWLEKGDSSSANVWYAGH